MTVRAEAEDFTHHTRQKSNFDRLRHTIFFITQIDIIFSVLRVKQKCAIGRSEVRMIRKGQSERKRDKYNIIIDILEGALHTGGK